LSGKFGWFETMEDRGDGKGKKLICAAYFGKTVNYFPKYDARFFHFNAF